MTDQSIQPALERIEEETEVVYDPEAETVTFTGVKNDTDHFVDFIEYLVAEEYITKGDIPYKRGHWPVRYLLNSSPTHQDGRDMTRPVKIKEEFYLETNLNTASKKRYMKAVNRDFVL